MIETQHEDETICKDCKKPFSKPILQDREYCNDCQLKNLFK